MLDIILFLLLGILAGIIMGLIPGIHPNMIILAVPLLVSLDIGTLSLLAFIIAMGITNSLVDFIPSILLGAPEGGTELSVLPGHRMLIAGYGYGAIKLCVVGGLLATVMVALMFPLLAVALPVAYDFLRPVIFLLLIFISSVIVLSEPGRKKLVAIGVFLFAGLLGLLLDKIPVQSELLLFPVFSGLFGISVLLQQLRAKTSLPGQKNSEIKISSKARNRSALFGTAGGIASGFLPGAGTSEIAALASVEKDQKSFLVTLGAISLSNSIVSVLALWLLGKSRSGLAVAVENFATVGLNESVFIMAVALVAAGIASIAALWLAKKSVGIVQKINYSAVSICVTVFLVVSVILFTGFYGLLLLLVCVPLGIFVNLAGVKRGTLMAVLMVPTILFYIGL